MRKAYVSVQKYPFHRSYSLLSHFIHFLYRPQGGKDGLVLGFCTVRWQSGNPGPQHLDWWSQWSSHCPGVNRNCSHSSMNSIFWICRLQALPTGRGTKRKIQMLQQKMGFQVESIKGQVFMCSRSSEPKMDWWHFKAPLMIHAANKLQEAAGASTHQRMKCNCFLVNRVIRKVFVPSC